MAEEFGIKQIAELANVSIGTVDRVLHDRPGVSKATAKRIKEIIKKFGYQKNTVASRLKLASYKKIVIAVLIPEASDNWSYWKIPKLGIDKALEELKGLGVVVKYHSFADPRSFAIESAKIMAQDYTAVISVPFFREESNTLLRRATMRGIPVVFLDTEMELDGKAYFVRQNSHNAGMVAARLLRGLVGNEGSYFVVNMLNPSGLHANNQQRENGFREFFQQVPNGSEVIIKTINHPLKATFEVSSEIETWFKKKGPKGVFVTNARSFLLPKILKSYGVENTFIVGFDINDQNKECLLQNEIHFLIDQKPELQGYSAIKGLFKYLTENDVSELSMDIPVEIIVKENCGSV